MAVSGRIHSFESFGTLDGPGIRFVVFMQGCSFRCLYCHNRDTWDTGSGREYTVGQVVDELKKYINYIRFSGGGITVSGGEPTLQPGFVTGLFKVCRELGVHTSLDTNGHADPADLGGLLDFTDLILLDIKHIRSEKHKFITGTSFDKTEAFAREACARGIPLWIRYVLVPGLTDDEEDLLAAATFIKSLETVEKIEVLPYHRMGAYKWEELGLEYPLSGVPEPTPEAVEKARKILTL